MVNTSREITDLDPDLQDLYGQFKTRLDNVGKNKDFWGGFLVTCTWRSNEEQKRLYDVGRTIPGKILTNAKPGQSEHNIVDDDGKPSAEAFDIVPLIPNEKGSDSLDWDGKSQRWGLIRDMWNRGFSTDNYYLDWYGRKDAPFYELPHFCLKYYVKQ